MIPEPLDRDDLVGRGVVVPFAQYPGMQCDEWGGAGWGASVVKVSRGCVDVKFDKWEGGQTFPIDLVMQWTAIN